MRNNETTTTLYMSKELKAWIKKHAANNGQMVAAQIRIWISTIKEICDNRELVKFIEAEARKNNRTPVGQAINYLELIKDGKIKVEGVEG